MIKILKAVIVLSTLFQEGYLQENGINTPTGTIGQYGTYPSWPFDIQTMNGNYPNPRRQKKPCMRRMNSNGPISEDLGSQWIPTYTAPMAKPLKDNNLMSKSRSLTDKDFKSTTTIATNNVVELNVVTEKSIPNNINEIKKSVSSHNDPCITSTTTEAVVSEPNYEQVGTNDNYYDVEEDSNEPIGYEYVSKTDDRSEIIPDDCNNKIKSNGNSRRFLTQHDQILSEPSVLINKEQRDGELNPKRIESKYNPTLVENNNALATRLQVEDSFERQIDETGRIGLPKSMPNELESNLVDPTKGQGISHMADGKVMLMRNTKVCYACSSVSDPTCWNPDRKTTVKYCRTGHDSCVTKTLKNSNALIVIRDCARSCDDTSVTGYITKYKSCSICHYDLCNSAYSVNIYNFMLFSSFLAVFKYSLCYI